MTHRAFVVAVLSAAFALGLLLPQGAAGQGSAAPSRTRVDPGEEAIRRSRVWRARVAPLFTAETRYCVSQRSRPNSMDGFQDFRKTTWCGDLQQLSRKDPGLAAARDGTQALTVALDRADWPRVHGILDDLEPRAASLLAPMDAVLSYWRSRWRYAQRLSAFMRDEPARAADREFQRRRETLEALLNRSIRSSDFATAAARDLPALHALMDEVCCARDSRTSVAATPAMRARGLPCPEPRSSLDLGVDAPARLDPMRSVATDGHYPGIARQEGRQGAAIIQVLVSDSGCVLEAGVVETSGDVELDAAALDWVLTGAVFDAAVKSGKPVTARIRFAVRFSLAD